MKYKMVIISIMLLGAILNVATGVSFIQGTKLTLKKGAILPLCDEVLEVSEGCGFVNIDGQFICMVSPSCQTYNYIKSIEVNRDADEPLPPSLDVYYCGSRIEHESECPGGLSGGKMTRCYETENRTTYKYCTEGWELQ